MNMASTNSADEGLRQDYLGSSEDEGPGLGNYLLRISAGMIVLALLVFGAVIYYCC